MDGFRRSRSPEPRSPQAMAQPHFQPRPSGPQSAGQPPHVDSRPQAQMERQFRPGSQYQPLQRPRPLSNVNNTLPDVGNVPRNNSQNSAEPFRSRRDTPERGHASSSPNKKPRRHKKWLIAFVIFSIIIAMAAGAYLWYVSQLKAVSRSTEKHSIVISDGDSTAVIAAKLKKIGVIRDELAFRIYAYLEGKAMVGSTCRVSPSQTVPEIVAKLAAGCRDFKAITFYPGGTLEASRYKASRARSGTDKTNARYVLKQAGFSDNDITTAFHAAYDSPLFADKPADAPLEGYMFGETYHVADDATAKQVLETVFAHMYKIVQKNNLVAKFKEQGLNLYQGITLASIVERELTCEDKPTAERKERCYQYQRGIAQVFIKRFRAGAKLGSDITAVYAADKAKIDIPKDDTNALVSIDSPYNTRKYEGLPPTPIAAPGELSLRAVANPTETDYNFFLAGDDGLIYFAKTNEEHEANVKNHCQKLCAAI